jgi:hypothetical protein
VDFVPDPTGQAQWCADFDFVMVPA